VIGDHLAGEPPGVDDRDVQQLGVGARLRIKAGPPRQRLEPIGGERRGLGDGLGPRREPTDANALSHHPAGIVGVTRPRQHRCGRIEPIRCERRLRLPRPRGASGLRLFDATANGLGTGAWIVTVQYGFALGSE
jgi:hypothetical protein